MLHRFRELQKLCYREQKLQKKPFYTRRVIEKARY